LHRDCRGEAASFPYSLLRTRNDSFNHFARSAGLAKAFGVGVR
jgi:hypothetical protein